MIRIYFVLSRRAVQVQHRYNQGETNANNLKLDFQQEEVHSEGRRSKTPSRPGTQSKKHREGTPGERRRLILPRRRRREKAEAKVLQYKRDPKLIRGNRCR
uniref:Uncharacterized protein n=1 Tax=Globodera rostochiensis TaxID=31243 RepID=A0A914HZM1_GLORO